MDTDDASDEAKDLPQATHPENGAEMLSRGFDEWAVSSCPQIPSPSHGEDNFSGVVGTYRCVELGLNGVREGAEGKCSQEEDIQRERGAGSATFGGERAEEIWWRRIRATGGRGCRRRGRQLSRCIRRHVEPWDALDSGK